jgi:hypothetical protein
MVGDDDGELLEAVEDENRSPMASDGERFDDSDFVMQPGSG